MGKTISKPNPKNLEFSYPPKWMPIVLEVVSLAGLVISSYLTWAHYASAHLLDCSTTGLINCSAVTTSPESFLFHIPVAVLGVVFFIAMVALNSPWAWKSQIIAIRYLRLGIAIGGIGMVFYLVYSELFVIGAICLWCSSVHVLTLIIFILVVLGTGKTAKINS